MQPDSIGKEMAMHDHAHNQSKVLTTEMVTTEMVTTEMVTAEMEPCGTL